MPHWILWNSRSRPQRLKSPSRLRRRKNCKPNLPRLAELDALLNMEHQSSRTEPEAEEKPDARPSVLAALEEKADKVEPVRPFKSYLDKDGDAR